MCAWCARHNLPQGTPFAWVTLENGEDRVWPAAGEGRGLPNTPHTPL